MPRPGFRFKTTPFDHQRTALERAYRRPLFAFLMEMGTGKTKVSIDEIGVYWCEDLIDIAVILAPKGVYRNWIGELNVHMGAPYIAEYWESGGGNKSKRRALERLCAPDPSRVRILVINIEALSSEKGIAFKYLMRFLQSGRAYAMVDEATKIKNPSAKRTKSIIKAGARCVFRRIATGSPVTNSPLDLFSQFEFLGPGSLGSTSYYNFRARYAVMQQKIFGGRKVQVVVGYRNQSDLSRRLAPHSYRVLKEECLDLPPKIYHSRDVELTDEQQSLYVRMRDDAFAEFGDTFTNSQSAITTLLRLQQIVCGHITDADGVVHSINSRRVDALMEELEEVRCDGIIWARFRHDIEKITEALRANYGEESVAEFHGGNTRTREEDAHRFINSDRCRWIVSNQQSGGYGNTWVNANWVGYFSNSFDYELRMQSEDRAHRSGQTTSVDYMDLIARGTVDERVVQALRNKINIAEAILGDSPRKWLI